MKGNGGRVQEGVGVDVFVEIKCVPMEKLHKV